MIYVFPFFFPRPSFSPALYFLLKRQKEKKEKERKDS